VVRLKPDTTRRPERVRDSGGADRPRVAHRCRCWHEMSVAQPFRAARKYHVLILTNRSTE